MWIGLISCHSRLQLDARIISSAEYQKPQSALEETAVKIWEKVNDTFEHNLTAISSVVTRPYKALLFSNTDRS